MNYIETQVKRTGRNRAILFGILSAFYFLFSLAVLVGLSGVSEIHSNGPGSFLFIVFSVLLPLAVTVYFFIKALSYTKENGLSAPTQATLSSLIKLGDIYAEFRKVQDLQRAMNANNEDDDPSVRAPGVVAGNQPRVDDATDSQTRVSEDADSQAPVSVDADSRPPVRFCSSCGKPLAEYEAFCTRCGHQISGGAQVPTPRVITKPTPTVPGTDKPASARPSVKVNWAVIAGTSVFLIIIAAFLIPGWLNRGGSVPPQNTPSSRVPLTPPSSSSSSPSSPIPSAPSTPSTSSASSASPSPSDPSSSPSSSSSSALPSDASASPFTSAPSTSPSDSSEKPAQKQEFTKEQRKILDGLTRQFPEVLPGLVDQIMISDELFLAAAKQAFYANPVFDDYSLTVTLMLPDPRAESLEKLGIAPYQPRSGAQAYIRDSYEKLRQMRGISDWLEYPVQFQFQKEISGENALDPKLFALYFTLTQYSEVFKPHIDKYISDLGFYAAALELLMPITGRWESSPDIDSGFMREYLESLATALEFKGIELDGKIVADKAIILKTLNERLAKVWVCDSVSVYTDVFQRQKLKARSLSGAFFLSVADILDAEYNTGRSKKPSSFEELERIFQSIAREKSEGIFTSASQKDRELYWEREYPFDWETLGKEGIAACPDLVDEIRSTLFSYDFHLRFLASWHGIGG